MPVNALIQEKLLDFERQGIPEVFERDLSLGNIQAPQRGNLVNVVVGARRCGKTYRLYQEMRRIIREGYQERALMYFNFEDERLKPYEPSLLQDVLDTFYALHPEARQEGAFLFFDEIQEVPEWGTFLRRVVDSLKATVYVTGSSSRMLSADLSSEFRGRSLSRELFSMGFAEFARFKGVEIPAQGMGFASAQADALRGACALYLERGGFIAPLAHSTADGLLLLQEYAYRTVAMDVVERYDLHNPRAASLFLSRCLSSSGRELSINKVHGEFKARGVAVSRETLGNLLAYYEDAYLLFPVAEFSRAVADNPRAVSKIYAVDPGMFAAFSPASASDLGQRLETAVFDQLRRDIPSVRKGSISRLLIGEGTRRVEVDFVVGDALLMEASHLIQVCANLHDESTRNREITALRAAMRRFRMTEGLVVAMDEDDLIEVPEGAIRVIPAWKWLLFGLGSSLR